MIIRKDIEVLEKSTYKNDVELSSDNHGVSVDLQKVILFPHLPFYKTATFTSRLIIFNETFAPFKAPSENVFACMRNEDITGRMKDDLVSTF